MSQFSQPSKPSRQPLSKQSLSPARLQFVELLRNLWFGRIERLQFRDGEPVVSSVTIVIREHKFGGQNGPPPRLKQNDQELKQQLVELFAWFDELRQGEIDVLEVQHGLPFRMAITESRS